MSPRHAEEAAVIVTVVLGLEAHEVVVAERADALLLARDGEQKVRRRAGDMQEEAERILVTARAQFPGERDQVIIVNPDQVVGLEELGELVGEQSVHPEVARKVRPTELRQIHAIVQDRP